MGEDRGYIRLYRKIQESEMYRGMTAQQRDVLIQLLLLANHSGRTVSIDGRPVELRPGEFITSLPALKAKCAKNVSVQNIRTCLLILKKWQFLTNHSTNKYRHISICNWERYQGKSTGTPTGSQQANNRHLTANNNDKNEKNEDIGTRAASAGASTSRDAFLGTLKGETRELWDAWERAFSPITSALEDNRAALNRLLSLEEGDKDRVVRLFQLAAKAWSEPYTQKEVKVSSPKALYERRGAILAWGRGRYAQQTTNRAI